MYDIFQMVFLGFVIGLTGALAPGPTLVATINASINGDWMTGLKVSLGHAIVELFIVILILLGLATIALPYTSVIAGVGGIALIVFGALTIMGSRQATMSASPDQPVSNPYMAGLVTSAANPYFWIWWLSVGSAMVIAGLEGGLVLAGAFMIGHWTADTVWYTLVSSGVSKGRTFLSDTAYRNIMIFCGIFLILFGIYYLSRQWF
ncbi:MAG TPA: LysE family transporter [Methanoregula sp.]|nr:LysE family transporter [Methanoregula sp.]